MGIMEMKEQIKRVEDMTLRGLLTPHECEQRIDYFIGQALPHDSNSDAKIMQERRLAYRRKWRFMIELTKDPDRVC